MSRLQAAVFQVLEGFTLSDDVRKILEAAYYADDTFAQGRAAVQRVIDEMRGSEKADGDTLEGWSCDLLAALSPTSFDAGKDDARDAARYRWLRECGEQFKTLEILDICGDIDAEALDKAIDAALSSLEVIGKGEKG